MRTFAAATCLLALVVTAVAMPGTGRKPAPRVAGTTLDGKSVSLAALRGKPVFINVWSSW